MAFKEAAFPATYRDLESSRILDSIRRQRSIAVVGLSGMGKSNVLRFLVSNDEARRYHLGNQADSFLFLYVDGNKPRCRDAEGLCTEMARQLISQTNIKRDTSAPVDGSALLEQCLDKVSSLCVAFCLDRFDSLATRLTKMAFEDLCNELRSLRDFYAQASITYVLSSRLPILNLHELDELMDRSDGPCWVGPLCEQDAYDSIRRDETRIDTSFTDKQRNHLFTLTGGHPGLLKNASDLLASGRLLLDHKHATIKSMLSHAGNARFCREIWAEISGQERTQLRGLARDTPAPAVPLASMRLVQMGLVSDWQIFSPVFAQFVRDQPVEVGMRIESPDWVVIEAADRTVRRQLGLGRTDVRLLEYVCRHQGEVVSKEDVIEHMYQETYYKGIDDTRYYQSLKRVRKALEPIIKIVWKERAADETVVTVRGIGLQLQLPHR